MQVDDRLLTVLQNRPSGDASARTQFRQLADILGQRQAGHAWNDRRFGPHLNIAAHARLTSLAAQIPTAERAGILRYAKLRNIHLVKHFAEDAPDIASAALHGADLAENEWLDLIPDLPVRARGFLRERGGLPDKAQALLDELGVQDRGLPRPASDRVAAPSHPITKTRDKPNLDESANGIAHLVQRIEAYKKNRSSNDATKTEPPRPPGPIDCFDFTANASGEVEWASGAAGPSVTGTRLFDAAKATHLGIARLFEQRLPATNFRAELDGSPLVAGTWRIDATPQFSGASGRFERYVGRARRLPSADRRDRNRSAGDRVRQLLHELRTPVTAIQGFAEVIQQQVFGETPHGYRALAASIAGDSALMLAGFDELDRLVRLENGAIELPAGQSDIASALRHQVDQLATVVAAKVAKLEIEGSTRCEVTLDPRDAEQLAWRYVAALASVLGAGEECVLRVDCEGDEAVISCSLPERLCGLDDIFSADVRTGAGAISASLFGAGFALRVARAEAEAVGGSLVAEDGVARLSLPLVEPEGSTSGITLSDIARRARNA